MATLLTGQEIAKHNTRQSCWIIVRGNACDVTDFLDDHPGEEEDDGVSLMRNWSSSGGRKIILKYAGKDATLGPVYQSAVAKVKVEITDGEKARLKRVEAQPPLSEILNLHDFETIARHVIPEKRGLTTSANHEVTAKPRHHYPTIIHHREEISPHLVQQRRV